MLLSSLVSLPLLGAAVIAFLDEERLEDIRKVGLFFSGVTFLVSLLLWVLFDSGTAD